MHDDQRGQHAPRRDAARLVLILYRRQPWQRLVVAAVVAHRLTLIFQDTHEGPTRHQRISSVAATPIRREAAADDLRDSHRQFQPCPRKLWIFLEEETALRIVVAAVPQRMELRGEVVEIEGDPVRLVRQRRALEHARILRRALDQRQFLVVEQRQVGRLQRGPRPPRRPCACSELIRAWAYWT